MVHYRRQDNRAVLLGMLDFFTISKSNVTFSMRDSVGRPMWTGLASKQMYYMYDIKL